MQGPTHTARAHLPSTKKCPYLFAHVLEDRLPDRLLVSASTTCMRQSSWQTTRADSDAICERRLAA